MKTRSILFLIIIIVLTGCASAPQQPLAVQGAWARPALAGQNSAVYFAIDNPNQSRDKLIAVASDAAGQAELHRSSQDEQGVMSMHPQHFIDIPAEDQVIFAPGGLHVMLVDLTRDLTLGDTIELRLTFEKGGVITLQAPVQEGP